MQGSCGSGKEAGLEGRTEEETQEGEQLGRIVGGGQDGGKADAGQTPVAAAAEGFVQAEEDRIAAKLQSERWMGHGWVARAGPQPTAFSLGAAGAAGVAVEAGASVFAALSEEDLAAGAAVVEDFLPDLPLSVT